MKEKLYYIINGRSDTGKIRDHNEDDLFFSELPRLSSRNTLKAFEASSSLGVLLVVADGMGGMQAGEVASNIAIQTIAKRFEDLDTIPYGKNAIQNWLKETLIAAHQAILDDLESNPLRLGMGTTVIVGWILEEKLHVAWLGDSRCYLYRGQELKLLTNDHAPVWDLVLAGALSPEEARIHPNSHLITQFLGQTESWPEPDYMSIGFKKYDQVLLCSDGLNGMLPDDQIADVLGNESYHFKDKVRQLIDAANRAGGEDNITAVMAGLVPEKEVDRSIVISTKEKPQKEAATTTGKTAVEQKSKDSNLWLYLFSFFVVGSVLAMILFDMYKPTQAQSYSSSNTNVIQQATSSLNKIEKEANEVTQPSAIIPTEETSEQTDSNTVEVQQEEVEVNANEDNNVEQLTEEEDTTTTNATINKEDVDSTTVKEATENQIDGSKGT